MATPKIKATYSLDVETVDELERLASRWQTSKSDVIRRLVRQGAASTSAEANRRIAALDRAQKALGLTQASADAWVREVRAIRKASFPRLK